MKTNLMDTTLKLAIATTDDDRHIPVIWSADNVKRSTIPHGLHKYHAEHSDYAFDTTDDPDSIVRKSTNKKNFRGTIITFDDLDLFDDYPLYINDIYVLDDTESFISSIFKYSNGGWSEEYIEKTLYDMGFDDCDSVHEDEEDYELY